MVCEKLPGWEYLAGDNSLTLIAPSIKEADNYLAKLVTQPEKFLRWQNPINLYLKAQNGTRKYKIPMVNNISGSVSELPDDDTSETYDTRINPITLSPDADYQRVTEWFLARWHEGKSVCVTSQIDDKCLYQNDRLTPQRAVLTPAEWIGYGYRWLWRDSMDDYNELRRQIDNLSGDRDYVAGFEYRLRRPDGKLCRYQTDYYKVTYLGVPCRVGVSSLNNWEILED